MSRWTSRVVPAFGLWLVIALAAWVLGNEPRPGLLALYVALGTAVVAMFLDVSADAETSHWPGARADPVRDPGEDPRYGQLRRVVGHHLDSREVGGTLHRRLAELADHRLVARHGITREADPAQAARLLGPDLMAVADARPPYPRLSATRIAQLLDRIEAL